MTVDQETLIYAAPSAVVRVRKDGQQCPLCLHLDSDTKLSLLGNIAPDLDADLQKTLALLRVMRRHKG